MYTSKIDKYKFELDAETNRIIVYKEGNGVDPFALISAKNNISEKEFHYEIMHWAIENKAV